MLVCVYWWYFYFLLSVLLIWVGVAQFNVISKNNWYIISILLIYFFSIAIFIVKLRFSYRWQDIHPFTKWFEPFFFMCWGSNEAIGYWISMMISPLYNLIRYDMILDKKIYFYLRHILLDVLKSVFLFISFSIHKRN